MRSRSIVRPALLDSTVSSYHVVIAYVEPTFFAVPLCYLGNAYVHAGLRGRAVDYKVVVGLNWFPVHVVGSRYT